MLCSSFTLSAASARLPSEEVLLLVLHSLIERLFEHQRRMSLAIKSFIVEEASFVIYRAATAKFNERDPCGDEGCWRPDIDLQCWM